MITVNVNVPEFEEHPYTMDCVYKINDTATATEVVQAFVDIMKSEGYYEPSIYKALLEVANELEDIIQYSNEVVEKAKGGKEENE